MIEQKNKKYNSQFLEGCNTDWNLYAEFIHWLNYWFKEFLEKAEIKMDFYKFMYKDKEYTQKDIIERVIELTDELISTDVDWYEKEMTEKIDEVFDLFHLVFFAMWW